MSLVRTFSSRGCMSVVVCLAVASCAARDAATLATITSDHVNRLNVNITEPLAKLRPRREFR